VTAWVLVRGIWYYPFTVEQIVAFDNLGWFSIAIHLLDRHNGTVSAAATVAICGLTAGLLWTTEKQARLTREAVNLARAEFTAAHPPKLVLREVVMEADWVIAYTLANVGSSPATVLESWVLAEYPSIGQPARNPRSAGYDDLGRLTFAPGEIKDLTYTMDRELSRCLDFPNADRLNPNRQTLFPNNLHFAGAILFEDAQHVLRRTVFRRQWIHALRRFGPSPEPESEYAE
jgi:hypothetical protein